MANKSKTNALRMLDAASLAYVSREYSASEGFTSGSDIARQENLDPDSVFKTLVTVSGKNDYFVCVIPVDSKLNLKKAAVYFGVKKLEMLPSKELLGITGYIHGGCSPVGMKKLFPTVYDETALLYESIYVSGGRIGLQIEISPYVLAEFTKGGFEDITE